MSDIRARFKVSLGAFTLDAEFTVPAAGVIGVFGPSGAGKTTLLRCIAGLTKAKQGFLAFGEETWQDDSRGVFVPVHQRGIGLVFQEPSLFPHLSVRKNVMYGFKRIAGRRRSIQFRDAVEWTGIALLLERMPSGLSGGERQRVAIARALLSSPKLLLMDEPLSSIDEASRAEIISCLDRLHRELSIPVLMVSHSLREIARLADTLVLMRDGGVMDIGPLHTVLPAVCAASRGTHDPDIFSVIDAPILEHDETYHLSRLHTPFGPVWAGAIATELGEMVRVQISARDVSVSTSAEPQSSIINQFPARIAAAVDEAPGHVLLELVPADAEIGDTACIVLSLITRRSWDHLKLAVGQTVYARVKGVSILR